MEGNNASAERDLTPLLTAAAAGDQSAFALLLSRYTPLLERAISAKRKERQDLSPEDENDLRQEAYLAFFRAIGKFDVAQNTVSFGLFAKICVNNALSDALSHRTLQTLSLDDSFDDVLEDAENDPTRPTAENEDYLSLCRLIAASLSPFENTIWQRYIAGQIAAEIAAALDKDARSVHNAIYRIRHKLRHVDAIRRRERKH